MKNKFTRYFAIISLICSASAEDAWAQGPTLKGTIKDQTSGESLPGATVVVQNTKSGTVTDGNGYYTLNLNTPSDTILVSYIGYLTQIIPVAGRTQLDVNLVLNTNMLGDVVIIGYGTVQESDATGSTATVSSEDFNAGIVNSPQELLRGKTAGVVVTDNSGAPGNSSTIRIRGGASLNASNDPLIVIDGVPVSNSGLGGAPNIWSIINPNDVETFTVLKDASATAVYGARASNGVIIITTKRGGKDFKVNYNFTGTVYTAPKKVDVFTGDEFRALLQEQYPDDQAVLDLLGDANTDWQDEIYNTSFGQDHAINVSGTAKNMPYRVSLGYNNTDGILKTYNFERTTLSVGLDPSFFDNKLKVNLNFKGMINDNNFADQAAIGNAIQYDPTQPVYDGNTRWRGYTSWTTGGRNGTAINLAPGNPVARLDLTDNTSRVYRSIGNAQFDYELPFLSGLHAVLNLGYDYSESKGHNNVMDSTQWIYLPTVAGGQLNPYESEAKNELLDFYLTRSTDIKSIDSKLDFTAGYSWSHFARSGSDSTMNYMGEATTRVNVFDTEYYLLSFFGRLDYTFKQKYVLTATLRDDATSRFAPENRWGLFPAVALGWKMHEENFLKESKFISELKFRISYGVTGQQDIFGSDYPYISTYTISDDAARYPFGDQYYHTLRPDGYDRNIKWENTATFNVGFDFGILDDRFTGTLDVYRKESTDLIAFIPIPVGTNFVSSLTTNVGSMINSGVEFNFGGALISREKFQWDMGFNFTYNVNEISQLNLSDDPDFIIPLGNVGGTTSGTIQVHQVGESRASFYTYEQVYDENGKPLEDVYVDLNNDGIINASDLFVNKRPDPLVLMGLNSKLMFGKWDFAMSSRISLGNYVYNGVAANSTYRNLYNSMEYLSNVSTLAEETQFTNAQNTRFSSYYVENASFFRMDNVSLGYQFNNMMKDRLNLHMVVGVNNAFVITGYSGLDPEISGGIDNNFFPRTRSFYLGLNAQF